MEKQFITEEEKSSFENLRTSEEQIIIGLGQIEYQIQSLMLEKENIKNQLSTLKQTQVTLGRELTEKYGDGNVDLTTGEFTKA
tara:strand:+ start:6226 stop:6474 length:249 start_codon:yes stop_codon:yes gene_type:complete